MSNDTKGTVDQFLEQMGIPRDELYESTREKMEALYGFVDVSSTNARSGRTFAMALATLKVAMDNPGVAVDLVDHRHSPRGFPLVGDVIRIIVSEWPESTKRKFEVRLLGAPPRVRIVHKSG